MPICPCISNFDPKTAELDRSEANLLRGDSTFDWEMSDNASASTLVAVIASVIL